MEDSKTDKGPNSGRAGRGLDQRLVYVMPERSLTGSADDEVNLRDVWDILWGGKWIVIALTTLFLFGAIVYALSATEIYRSEALLAPAEEKSTPTIGGLAALAGVSVGGAGSAEALAVLKSRQFLHSFIEQHNLMPLLFHDRWNAERGEWILGRGEEAPDIRAGVNYFREKILHVRESRETGLVTVGVEWTDPEIAAEWVSNLIRRLNDRLRERALQEAERNVAYLRSEVAKTNTVALQQSIGRLLESEMQKLMLARGNEEFAFNVLDPAVPPTKRSWPKRSLIVGIGTVVGGMLGVFLVFFRHAVRAGFRDSETNTSPASLD